MTHEEFQWIMAVVWGVAFAAAMASMAYGWKRVLFAVVFPLIIGGSLFLKTVGGEVQDGGTALRIFITLSMVVVLVRLVFARWLREQRERYNAGYPPPSATFLNLTVVMTVVLGGGALSWALLWWLEVTYF
ncbi:hypothetical protein [Nocardiopsis suaedae]|uniref:Integral membrane protein n=1 Tax=Nocardiopsis suaedae TaxID=3018444 RepID=A0ABT4TKZ6_9ACTN|nr:hypothetical protein [Nocardiopsis suaedae]MDA2804889.1 hypothetical protein [Nocardiopsis suaedae]